MVLFWFWFSAGKLMGMNEITEKLVLGELCQSDHAIVQRVTSAANISRVPCGSDKECRWEADMGDRMGNSQLNSDCLE